MLYSSIRFVIIFLYDMMLENEPSTVAFIQSIVKIFLEIVLFQRKMGRDGDGECKDFAKGVCFRGARLCYMKSKQKQERECVRLDMLERELQREGITKKSEKREEELGNVRREVREEKGTSGRCEVRGRKENAGKKRRRGVQ